MSLRKPYRTHTQGFTLIELLVVIAIIGLLSSIVLASLNSARTKGETAAAESNMHAAATDMAQCMLTDNGFPYCYGTSGNHTSSYSCGGGMYAKPVVNTALCGAYTGAAVSPGSNFSTANWPDVSSLGYAYANYADGNDSTKSFNFEIYRTSGGSDYICCTQNGCSHVTENSSSIGTNCKALAGD